MTCPRCKRPDITPLAVEGDIQRFQCRSCGENFSGARLTPESSPQGSQQRGGNVAHVAHVAIAPPEPSDLAHDIIPAGKCSKCGKPYYRLGKKFEEHIQSCDGTPWIAPVPRKRAPRAGAFVEGTGRHSAVDPLFATPAERAVMPQGTSKALGVSIDALKVQRSVLEAEIAELDRTIMVLEKLKGLGGEPSIPFTAPAEAPNAVSAPPPGSEEPMNASEPVSEQAGT